MTKSITEFIKLTRIKLDAKDITVKSSSTI